MKNKYMYVIGGIIMLLLLYFAYKIVYRDEGLFYPNLFAQSSEGQHGMLLFKGWNIISLPSQYEGIIAKDFIGAIPNCEAVAYYDVGWTTHTLGGFGGDWLVSREYSRFAVYVTQFTVWKFLEVEAGSWLDGLYGFTGWLPA